MQFKVSIVTLTLITCIFCSGEDRGSGRVHALSGVPDIPWCRKNQTPKKDNCRNGSNSGGLY